MLATLRDDGERGASLAEPTQRNALLDQVEDMVGRARQDDLIAVGVGLPRTVEFATGRVVSSDHVGPELPLGDIPLRDVLTERLGVPVFVDNEASAAALAEAHDAELELVTRHLVLIGIGERVGGGLILDGLIYRGATGAAGELGQTIIGLDLAGAVPAPMRFPQTGSLEYVAAGHALDRLATVAGYVKPGSVLGRLRAEGKPVLGADVIAAALAGDRSAARMVEIWGQRIGIAVANAITTFDPDDVVIAGDAASAGELLLEPARRVGRAYVRPGLGARTRIRLARHVALAGVLGAALLARYEL